MSTPQASPPALRVKHAARAVAAGMFAHAIWRTGDMSTAHDELDRSIVQRMYRDEVPMRAAASWLNRSTRWLQKLANRRPRKSVAHEPLQGDVLQLLIDHSGRWFSASQLVVALGRRDVATCANAVQTVLDQLVKVRQVTEARSGHERRYCATESLRVFEARGLDARREAVTRRVEALPEIIEQYVAGVPGSAFGVLRYSIPAGQEEAVAAKLRQAASRVLQEASAVLDARPDDGLGDHDGTTQVTYMVVGGVGTLGTLPPEVTQ